MDRYRSECLGAAGGNGNSINQLLTVSLELQQQEVIYTILAEANGCVGTPTQIEFKLIQYQM